MSPPLDRLPPIVLRLYSNIVMTFAWYPHLKYKSSPLPIAIAASWGIALLLVAAWLIFLE